MGDSFISGEGAVAYATGDGAATYDPFVNGDDPSQYGPRPTSLWTEDERNPYFCHRSPSASVKVASISWVEARFNLACSGAWPDDIRLPSARENGGVDAQVDQLRDIAEDYDVDVILLGVGSNNSHFTFGSLLGLCHGAFMADAAGGLVALGIAGWLPLVEGVASAAPELEPVMDNNGCTQSDFPDASVMADVRGQVVESIEAIVDTMSAAGYEDGEYRIVVQSYTSPVGDTVAALEADGNKTDNDNVFAGLAAARYIAGCPFHWDSMPMGDYVAGLLAEMLQQAVDEVRASNTAADIGLLDVQRAFDGARVCEITAGPPTAAELANPLWFRDSDGTIERALNPSGLGTVITRWRNLAEGCTDADDPDSKYQLCQESSHPSIAGHAVLGRCLAQALVIGGPRSDWECIRDAGSGTIETRTI